MCFIASAVISLRKALMNTAHTISHIMEGRHDTGDDRKEEIFVQTLPEFTGAHSNVKWSMDGMLAVASQSSVRIYVPTYENMRCYLCRSIQIGISAELKKLAYAHNGKHGSHHLWIHRLDPHYFYSHRTFIRLYRRTNNEIMGIG